MGSHKKKTEINEYLLLVYHFALVMLIYSVCRILFFAFNASMFPNVTLHGFLNIMLGGLKFDVSALLYLNIIYFLLAIFPHPWKYASFYRSFLKWFFILVNSIGIAMNAIDFEYYPFILKRTTANVADILRNEENMGSLWFQFLIDYWYVFVIWLSLVLLLIWGYGQLVYRKTRLQKTWWAIPYSLLVLFLFGVVSVIGIRGGYRHSTRPITLSNAGDFVQSPEEVAIVLNTPFSVIRTIGKKSFAKFGFFKSESSLAEVYTPVVMGDSSKVMNRKNIVVIILESFSREHFGVFNPTLEDGHYQGYTPFLDSLAHESLIFPNAFANGRKSIDALPSITSSLPALVLPYVISEYSSNKVNSLASLLKSQGYHSSFYHGAPNGSMGFSAFTNLVGFDKYIGMNEFNDNRYFDGMWGIWDEEFLQFFAAELEKEVQPFFSSVFTLSSHHPFDVPERYKDFFPDGAKPLHKCIRYTDYALKLFFEKARKSDWYHNSIFVIVADHSTSPVHEEYKNNMNAFAIPLILFTPDGVLKGVDNRLAQQTDIMPTILSHLNYPGSYISFGNNLLETSKPAFALNYVGDTYQFLMEPYVIYFDGKKLTSVFNFKNDPYLKSNLLGKVDISLHENYLKAVLQQYNNRMINNDLIVR